MVIRDVLLSGFQRLGSPGRLRALFSRARNHGNGRVRAVDEGGQGPLCRGDRHRLRGLLAIVGFGPRTQDFGWLCFIAVYAILLRFRSAKRAPLWAIPPIFAIWINCHGTWPFGLIIFAIFIAAGLVRQDFGQLVADPWSPSELKRLLLTAVAAVAALLVNPFGYRMLLYPFDMAFHQSLGVANVEEWASVNFNDLRGKLVGLLLVAIFLMVVNGRKRWRVDDALLTLFVLYSGLSHVRFLLLAGLVLPPLLASKLGRLSSYDPLKERRFLNFGLLAATAAICILAFPSSRMLESEVSEEFPAGAVQFLRDHPQQGHIYNLYQWGGYLEWNLPQVPTFIDSRNDIFEYRGVLKDYLDVASVNQSQEILDRYQVNYVLYPAVPTLPYFLSKSSYWERIYSDRQAVIYRRVTSP